MARDVEIDNLAEAIAKELLDYQEEVAEGVFDAVDAAAKACNDEIKSHLSRGHGIKTGKYKKSFSVTTTEETKFSKKKTWHVKAPNYRITHLLENGHALRQGGRSPAVKHITYGEEKAAQVLEEHIERAVQSE